MFLVPCQNTICPNFSYSPAFVPIDSFGCQVSIDAVILYLTNFPLCNVLVYFEDIHLETCIQTAVVIEDSAATSDSISYSSVLVTDAGLAGIDENDIIRFC